MKLLQKRPVAAVIMVLAILAGIALGQRRKPADTTFFGDFDYVLHNERDVISDQTADYIGSMNASLFAQTGAQIVVDVVKTTGDADIVDYAEDVFDHYGIGSKERDNGILIVLALENIFEGEPDGDYCMSWGAGFTRSQQDDLDDILVDNMEEAFVVQRYDLAVRQTFDALIDYLEGVYHVSVRQDYYPPATTDYHAISGNYSTTASGHVVPTEVYMAEIVTLIIVLLIIWIIADAMRYRRYQRRCLGPGMIYPPVRYYPIFWGRRPRAPRPPRPPRSPPPFPPPP